MHAVSLVFNLKVYEEKTKSFIKNENRDARMQFRWLMELS